MKMSDRKGRVSTPGSKTRIVASLAALALVAGACGSGDNGATGTPAPAPAAPAPAAPGVVDTGPARCEGNVEITLWHGRENFNPADDWASFHAEYPNIRVKWDVIPLEQAPTDFIRAHNAGNAPDILNISADEIPALAQGGYVRDMTVEFAAWEDEDPELWNSLFDPLAIQAASWEGIPYGVALHTGPEWYVYRIDLLKAAGYDEPAKTWDEFVEIARATTGNGVFGYTQVLSRGQGFQAGPLTVFMAMGGQHDEQDYPILDSPAGIEWLRFHQVMMREGLIDPETLAWKSGDKRAAFIGGRASQGLISQNILGRINEEFEYGVEWAAVPPPVSTGREADWRHKARTWSWLVNSDTKCPYEVSLALRYLSQPENLEEVALRYLPSTSTAVLEGAAYNALPWIADIGEAFKTADFMPVASRQGELAEIGLDAMQEAVLNPNADPIKMAKRYQALIDALKN